ncbi:MAG: DUF2141 domain-containing protein [Chlorobium sp.]|nr:MAG: DUF2141 domain-containing protein [Chlorobium sp.]
MKKITTLFLSFFFAATVPLLAENLPAQVPVTQEQAGNITVHVIDLKRVEGLLRVSLYNSEKGFPGEYEQASSNRVKKITATSEDVVFENLPYGSYAVSAMHDENSNGKLDKRSYILFSIPKEGVGVSNNPKIGKGGPKYKDCVFALNTKELEITVAMKYLFD